MFDDKLGKFCTHPECRQKDWLPFTCKYCSKVYCTTHYSLDSHGCSQFQKYANKVILCPLCNKTVKLNLNLSEQENFSIHQAMECSGDYIANVADVMKCGSCHVRLTELNAFCCSSCKKKTCLKHRMKEDHKCAA